jgi:N-acetylneuraminate synthase
MTPTNLGSRTLQENSQPYIIAEIGVNHEGSFETALRLIELAKEGGADAAKFQSYKAETLASKHSPAYWDLNSEPTQSQYELFKKYDSFGENEYTQLALHCETVGIDFLSTPFDDSAVEFLDPLMSYFKIASADLTNVPLLRRVARKNKPIVLSTGASTLAEIDAAVGIIRSCGNRNICLLHCVLNYPTQNENAHLGMISSLKRAYPDLVVGYSDHTVPCAEMKVLLQSYALGSLVIEKHFTHDKSLPGNDHYHAMDKEDLLNFRRRVNEYLSILGRCHKEPLLSEQISRENARRSVVANTEIPAGCQITESMITYKRPGTGIPISEWENVIGKTAARTILSDEVFSWQDLIDS